MSFAITFGPSGISIDGRNTVSRPNKGRSLIDFPSDFTILDLETTGLEPSFDEIIEIGALRVRSGKIVASFSSLIKPEEQISSFISELTGITNEMLETAPGKEQVLSEALDFIQDDIIVGHNINFDINFLYDNVQNTMNRCFSNDFIDTLRISRKVFPELRHHRLSDISSHLRIQTINSHRALSDCETTFKVYSAMMELIESTTGIQSFVDNCSSHRNKRKNYDLTKITTDNENFDKSHPLFGKHCVFTGVLEKMTRKEAAQLVVDLGGLCDNDVTKNTNYLILGHNDYCPTIRGGKSSKQKKAERYMIEGYDIAIMAENSFYELVLSEG